MADPVNYCSWIARGFCVTQSEWAAWTQAALTVITFIVALVKQHRTDTRSAKQKADSDAQLLLQRTEAERDRRANAEILLERDENRARLTARATAISLKPDLLSFECMLEDIVEFPIGESPKEIYKTLIPSLAIRDRSFDSLQIPDATNVLLDVTDAALELHDYLDACRMTGKFRDSDLSHLIEFSRETLPKVAQARALVDPIAKGIQTTGRSEVPHAAS